MVSSRFCSAKDTKWANMLSLCTEQKYMQHYLSLGFSLNLWFSNEYRSPWHQEKTVRDENGADSWSANALLHAGIIPSVFSITLSWTTCAFPFSRMFANTRRQQSDILLGKESTGTAQCPCRVPVSWRGFPATPPGSDTPPLYLCFRDLITSPFSFIYSELHAYHFSGLRIRGLLKNFTKLKSVVSMKVWGFLPCIKMYPWNL